MNPKHGLFPILPSYLKTNVPVDLIRTKDAMDTSNCLTAREAEVLQLLARGCTYSQVSDRLGVSLHTVESHVKNIYRKLDAHSARAAVWRAIELWLFGQINGTPSIAHGETS